MTQTLPSTQPTLLTYEEYLDYQGHGDTRYELWHGRLIPMPTATLLHSRICQFLVYQFQQLIAAHRLDFTCITNVAVRTEIDTVRIPDVLLCPQSLWLQIQDRPRAGVLELGETPVLVVEVASSNRRDDYILKMAEYAYNNIPEYWIIDPSKGCLWVMTQPDGEFGYSKTEFSETDRVQSQILPNLSLTVSQLFAPDRAGASSV
jgi:Uma2 family endonuclease